MRKGQTWMVMARQGLWSGELGYLTRPLISLSLHLLPTLHDDFSGGRHRFQVSFIVTFGNQSNSRPPLDGNLEQSNAHSLPAKKEQRDGPCVCLQLQTIAALAALAALIACAAKLRKDTAARSERKALSAEKRPCCAEQTLKCCCCREGNDTASNQKQNRLGHGTL